MTDRDELARLLVAQMNAMGLNLSDLLGAVASGPEGGGPTVAEFISTLVQSSKYAPRTIDTYRPYWRLFIELFGDRPLRSITPLECETVVEAAFARAKARYPQRACRSAKESCVGALRAVFGRAKRLEMDDTNPALTVDKPRRTVSNRRSLTAEEMTKVWDAVASTTHDPGLDLLLVKFHLWSGARRDGALKLTVADIDDARSTVWLHEKLDKSREQPLPPSLVAELVEHSQVRGSGEPGSPVFWTRQGRPLHRRRYNGLFDRVQAYLAWPRTPVTAHVLRQTAVAAVERTASYAGAVAFAGHQPDRSGVTGTYVKASVE